MSNPTILCVDDERNVLLMLRTQLTRHFPNYTFEIAESGSEALDVIANLQSEGVDIPIVITDQIMPGMMGDELLAELHARYPQILNVMLTGQARVEDVGNAVNRGNLYRFIAKPWDEMDLKLTVTEALRRYQQDEQLAQQQAELERANRELQVLNAELKQKAERDLQESEERYRLLSEISPVGIFRNDLQGRCIYANAKILEITGLTLEENLGEGWGKNLHPDDRDWMYAAWSNFVEQAQLGNDTEYLVEHRYLYPDGSVKWMLGQAIPERNAAGDVVGFVGSVIDITDRKQAELALQQLNQELEQRVQERTQELSEARNFLQAIVDNLPVALFVKNGKPERFGEFLLWNKTSEIMFGCTSAQAIGKTVYDFFPQEQSDFFHEKDRLSFQHRTVEDIPEEPINSLTLGRRLLHTIKVPLFDASGNPEYLVCISEDITDHKQAEIALRESEERFRQLADNVDAVFWMNDVENRELMYINRKYEVIWGRTCESLLENVFSFLEAVHPEDRDRVVAAFPKQVHGDYDEEYRIVRPNGEVHWIRDRAFPIQNDSGQVYRIAGIAEDITERKQTEESLRLSQEQLQLALEGSGDGLWDWNILTGEAYLSPRWLAILDYEVGELPGYVETWAQTLHPDDRPQVMEVLNAHMQDSSIPYQVEYRARTKTGEWKWIANYGKVVARNAEGTPSRMVGLCKDISDRKAAEAALLLSKQELEERVEQRTADLREAKEAAEAASRAKSIFLANMSHELRTPLNAILGFSQLLSHNPDLNSQQQRQIGTINRSGEHLLNLINDILEMSKIEAGRIMITPTNFDLDTLMENLQGMFANKAELKGLILKIERSCRVPRFVRTDERKLRQILINLLGNAIKFTHIGSVHLEIDGILNPVKTRQVDLHFKVKDTGSGISKEELALLFQPFMQTRSGQAAQTGTGLGLAISYQFAQLMGGQIEVSSTVNVGSCFDLVIPVEIVSEAVISQQPVGRRILKLAPNRPSWRILIVEDNKSNRELMEEILKPLGFEVEVVENGQQAVERWQQWQPDLIWMDMRMPVMNGYEATRTIKQHQQHQPAFKIPVIIALTASAFEEERGQILAVGCDDFVLKPTTKEVILEKLVEHLGVQYLYADEPEEPMLDRAMVTEQRYTLSSEDLAVMPTAWLLQLNRAASIADEDALVKSIEQIPPNHCQLANSLKELVDNFNLATIIRLTQPFVN